MSLPFDAASVAKQLDYCTFCPKMCRHACPVSTATGRETWIPQAKMDRLNQIRLGRVSSTVANTEPIWACTGCRQCTTYCTHGNEPGLVLMAGRARAEASGVGHPRLAQYPERFRTREHRLVDELHNHVPAERRAESGAVGFLPGCDAVDKGLDDVSATLSLFQRLGADDVTVVDVGVACIGYPLLAGGFVDMFRWHANKAARALNGYRTLVINCSACVHTLRASYPAEGVSMTARILSLSEFLAQRIDRLPTREGESDASDGDDPAAVTVSAPRTRKVVYYHDPCYLARYQGVVDEPRAVLERVADVREFGWSHEDTECCGGGGLLPKTMPDVADAMARRRLRAIANAGGGTVVTSCATCAFMLKRNAPSGVTVKDLPKALDDALDDGP